MIKKEFDLSELLGERKYDSLSFVKNEIIGLQTDLNRLVDNESEYNINIDLDFSKKLSQDTFLPAVITLEFDKMLFIPIRLCLEAIKLMNKNQLFTSIYDSTKLINRADLFKELHNEFIKNMHWLVQV